MFKYENLWALKLAKATPLWTPRLILWPRASMTLGVPVWISTAKKKMITKSPKFFTVSSESVKKSYVKKKDVNRTLPFEIVMALNDIIKAKKPVEDWKRSIWDIDQGSGISQFLCVRSYKITRNCSQGIWYVLRNWESCFHFKDFRALFFFNWRP